MAKLTDHENGTPDNPREGGPFLNYPSPDGPASTGVFTCFLPIFCAWAECCWLEQGCWGVTRAPVAHILTRDRWYLRIDWSFRTPMTVRRWGYRRLRCRRRVPAVYGSGAVRFGSRPPPAPVLRSRRQPRRRAGSCIGPVRIHGWCT